MINCGNCGQHRIHSARGLCRTCYSAERRAEGITVITHGYGGYTSGCRCEECKTAKREYMAARRGDGYLAWHIIPDSVTHGARSTFEEHGCRCDTCVTAQVERGRADSRVAASPARGAA